MHFTVCAANFIPSPDFSPFTSHFSRKRTAFTKPSRGTNESERRTITSGNRAFRFDCERCRLTRGAVDWANKKVAFTLAEVLITLGIIGVVAALTMPSLIQKYQKHVVASKLERFYSIMNQAIQRSEVDNGERFTWQTDIWNLYLSEGMEAVYNKYWKNYIKVIKTEHCIEDGPQFCFYLNDGSLVVMSYNGLDYYYHTDKNALRHPKHGKNQFYFQFYPEGSSGHDAKRNALRRKGLEPYLTNEYDGTRASLMNDQRHAAKLIQLNGWKIPDDYPFWD